MQRAINAAVLANSVVILGARIIPARRQFPQRKLIGRIAVNLVRGHEDEHGVGIRLPRRFQQVQRADGIHVEIHKRNLLRLVVRRLGGTVNDQVKPLRLEEIHDLLPVADVERHVGKAPGVLAQALKVPARVARRAKKLAAQIVINAEDLVPRAVVMRNGFRPDQSA